MERYNLYCLQLSSGLWLNRIQETSSHCSLIPIFSFLILPKISLYTQLFPAFLLSLHSVGTRLTPHSVGLIRLGIA